MIGVARWSCWGCLKSGVIKNCEHVGTINKNAVCFDASCCTGVLASRAVYVVCGSV